MRRLPIDTYARCLIHDLEALPEESLRALPDEPLERLRDLSLRQVLQADRVLTERRRPELLAEDTAAPRALPGQIDLLEDAQ